MRADELDLPVPLDRLRYDLMLNAEFDTDGVRVPAPRFRLNVTVPVGVPLALARIAVNVTDWP